jgi:crossover junction endodeoxyribonuclease RusA
VKVELPFPSPQLFPNRMKGKAWASIYKIKGECRETAFYLTKQEKRTWTWNGGNIKLKLTFVMPDKRQRDIDNCLAASKSLLDGMADALQVNDKFFRPIEINWVEGKKPGALIVEIEQDDQ